MKTYSVEMYDNVVNDDLRWKVWDYIQNQTFLAGMKDVSYTNADGVVIQYKPIDGKKEYLTGINNQHMHRTVFGNSEREIEFRHNIIYKLWLEINKHFDNKFVLDGEPEGVVDKRYGVARCYVNALPDESIKRSHAIHRDTIDLSLEKTYTMLYIANLQWYPTWMGENVFYSDDETTGDTQQFQKGKGQSRGFSVGEPFKIISPMPGRVILYDGRTLHTTKPTSWWAEQMRHAVVFRIREK